MTSSSCRRSCSCSCSCSCSSSSSASSSCTASKAQACWFFALEADSAAATCCSMRWAVPKSLAACMRSAWSSIVCAILSLVGSGVGTAFSTVKSTLVRKTSRHPRNRASPSPVTPTSVLRSTKVMWATFRHTFCTFCSANTKKFTRSLLIWFTASQDSTLVKPEEAHFASMARSFLTTSIFVKVASLTQLAICGMRNKRHRWPAPKRLNLNAACAASLNVVSFETVKAATQSTRCLTSSPVQCAWS